MRCPAPRPLFSGACGREIADDGEVPDGRDAGIRTGGVPANSPDETAVDADLFTGVGIERVGCLGDVAFSGLDHGVNLH